MPKLLKKRISILRKRHKPSRKHMSVLGGIIYGIGCGFGASIFVLIGEGIFRARLGILISLILGTLIILFSSLDYSEFLTSLHTPGGIYNIGKEGIGGTFAFIIGFFLWISNITISVFSANILTQTIIVVFPFLKDYGLYLIIVFITIIGLISFFYRDFSTKILIFLTVILLILFGIFIMIVIFAQPSSQFTNPISNPIDLTKINIFGIIQTFALLLILFKGIILNLAHVNLNLENINKNIPRVSIISVILSSVIYFLIFQTVLLTVGSISEEMLVSTNNLMATVLYQYIGMIGTFLMSIALIISTIITINASLGSATEVFKALVRDGYFSRPLFMKDTKKNKFSVNVLLINIIIAILFILLIFITGYTDEIISFIYFFSIAFINFGAVLLRYKRKSLDRPFKAPLFPYLPILIGIISLFLAFVLSLEAIILGIIIGILGILTYLLLIADRYSKIITLSGIKFLSIFIIGFFIWLIKNYASIISIFPGGDVLFLDILLRILIFFCVFALVSLFFDLFTVREVVNFFTKRFRKENIAITIGGGKIVEMNKRSKGFTYLIKYFLGLVEIVAALFIYILIFLLFLDIISIEYIDFGVMFLDSIAAKYLFISFLFIFSTTFLLRGLSRVYYNWETIEMNM